MCFVYWFYISYLMLGKVNNSKHIKKESSSVLRGWYPSGRDISEIDKITEREAVKASKIY